MGKASEFIVRRLRDDGLEPAQESVRLYAWSEHIMSYKLCVCGDEEKLAHIVDKIKWIVRGRRFRVWKFRTMVVDADQLGPPLTAGDDPRITRVGRWLRKTKLDELPQLLNILKGDMSLVGPRPEVPKYVEMLRDDFESILVVRPGLTDLASIKYRDESAVLEQASDPEHEYITRVLPDKIELAREYVRRSSLWMDFRLIILTLFRLFR